MRAEDLILVSVDDHVVEPPDLFERHLPARWRARAPRVVRKKNGAEVWLWEGQQVPNIGLNAVAGRMPEEYGIEPTRYDQMRPGCYDVAERVRDMSANGVLGSLCFPSFPGLCGKSFLKAEDKELALACLRAYNDWHADDWCASAPGRFLPLGLVPLWDPAATVAEVKRLARKGVTAVSFSEQPDKLGLPSLHDAYWDPFFRACDEEGTVLCMHIGSGQEMTFPNRQSPIDTMITTIPIAIVWCASDLVWSPILRTYRNLTFALSEGGIGWVPHFLERIDYVYEHHRAWTHQDFGRQKPSELFKERVVLCFIDDRAGVRARADLNVDMITWECDYPHSDTAWPTAPEMLERTFAGVPDEDVAKITHRNAMRIFRYDPFRHRPPERCTAGALRAEVAGHDVAPKSQRGGQSVASAAEGRVVTCGDVLDQLTTAMRTPLA